MMIDRFKTALAREYTTYENMIDQTERYSSHRYIAAAVMLNNDHDINRHVMVVKADNIADYVCGQNDLPKILGEKNNFKILEILLKAGSRCVRAPARNVWIEYAMPSNRVEPEVSSATGSPDLPRPVRPNHIAALVTERSTEDAGKMWNRNMMEALFIDHGERIVDRVLESPPASWLSISLLGEIEKKERYITPGFTVCFPLDEHGNFIHRQSLKDGAQVDIPVLTVLLDDMHPLVAKYLNNLVATTEYACNFFGHVLIILYTLAFCNTKNVVLVEQAPDEALNRRRRKRSQEPIFTTKIIQLTDLVTRYTQDGKARALGDGVPFQIVRGYWRDCRVNGLFGKYHGIFWIPQHTRGTRRRGEIKKRYETVTQEGEDNA